MFFALAVFLSCCIAVGCNDDDGKDDNNLSNTQTPTETSTDTVTGATSSSDNNDNDTVKSQTMTLSIADKKFNADLEDSQTVKELMKLLPMEVNMQELNGNEKYVYLSSDLPTASYKPGTINKGDIMLFGKNCLVIFYKTFSSSYSYTKIGHINNTDSLEESLGKGNITVKFE
ncbi:MAG: hypothetical protein IJ759_05535 [Bacteroidales bacterium]|nr:hypothetical protein [Bacteroidales bacterium]